MAEVSVDDFLSGSTGAKSGGIAPAKRELSPAEFLGQTPADPLSREALEAENTIGGAVGRSARRAAENTAALLDLGLGLPGQALQVGLTIGGRIKAIASGGSRADAELVGKSLAAEAPESLTNPIQKLMKVFGYEKGYSESDVTSVMNTAGDWLAKGGEWVEKKTKGVLSKADVEDLTNTILFAVGSRATSAALQPKIDALGKPKLTAPDNTAAARAEALRLLEAENAPIVTPTGGVIPKRPGPEPRMRAMTPQEMRALEATELQARRQKRADVRAAFLEEPDYATRQQRLAEGMVEQRELAGRLPPEMERTRAPAATSVDEAARTLEQTPTGDLRVTAPAALDSGLAKIARGRPFDLDATELAAVNASRSVWNRPKLESGKADQKLLTAAAVGATGLGLAMAYKPDAEEAALAIGGGALVLGRGRGQLTLERLGQFGEATPLNAILQESPTTLLTLERLPQNRFEFPVEMIRQQLARTDVTKAEKDVFENVLKNAGEKVTAKELMTKVKLATQDFELGKKDSDAYAPYGLENIDRLVAPDDFEFQAWVPEGATPEEAARLEAEAQAGASAREVGAPPATTHIWQSPIKLGSSNHFGDPNYFGHTRVFEEGGVRHVVEIQSDYAQKVGPELKPEQRAQLEQQREIGVQMAGFWDNALQAGVRGAQMNGEYVQPALRTILQNKNRLATQVGHDDFMLNFESNLFDRVEGSDVGAPLARAYRAEYASKLSPESRAKYEADRLRSDSNWDISEGFAEWLTQPRQLTREQADYLETALAATVGKEKQKAQLFAREATAKLGASVNPAVAPMVKNWHKRLVREELADAARPKPNPAYEKAREEAKAYLKFYKQYDDYPEVQAQMRPELDELVAKAQAIEPTLPGEKVVRFATADTVAKVEGWPDEQAAWDRAAGSGSSDRSVPYHRPETRFSPQHQGIYNRYKSDVEKFLKQLGGKEYTDSAGHTWIEVPVEGSKATPAGPRAQQFGGVDPELAATLTKIGAGAAVGAYLSSEEGRAKGAAFGAAVAGLALFAKSRVPAISDMAQAAGRGAEYGLGLVSTRVRNMSPALLRQMRDFEMGTLVATNESLQKIAPFIESLRKVPADLRERLNAAILTNEPKKILDLLAQTGNPQLVKEWGKARALLQSLGADLVKTGKLKDLLPDYYPRLVIDVPGLLKALGAEERSFLQKKIDAAAAQTARRDGRDLSPLETSNIVNKYLKSRVSGGKPGFLKARSVDEVTTELAQFYAPASESLPLYVRAAVKEVQRAKFFGDNLVRDAETGSVNMDLSIGNVVNKERFARNLDDAQVEELRSILNSRFGPGERASAGPIQTFKNLTNAGLLGHITSAAVQLGDIGISVAAYGLLPTIKALQQVVTRSPARMTVRELGLVDHISEEFVSAARKPMIVAGREISSAKFVDAAFRLSGFSLVDQLGKATAVNAALNRYRVLAQTPKGIERITQKYGRAYDKPELDQLVADLRSGEMTDLTRSLLFSELSDIQPISKVEVPQAYLDMPNGRVVYMLKTYMLKQLDLARREVIGEMRAGRVGRGTENALRISLALGISGASTAFITNWILGKDDKLEWGDLPENILKTYGWSQFVADKARKGDYAGAAASFVIPPLNPYGDVVKAVKAAVPPYDAMDEAVQKDPRAVTYVPVVGRLLYNRALGGAEKANEKRAAEEAREEEERYIPKELR